MKWTEYPTTADHAGDRNGIPREGKLWSPGPRAGTQWVIPDGDDSHYALVRKHGGFPAWSVPADNYPRHISAGAGRRADT